MSVEVNIGNGIYVSRLTTNSTISNGQNSQFGWSSHQKRTYIFNTSGPYMNLSNNKCVIIDNDEFDTIILDEKWMYGSSSQHD